MQHCPSCGYASPDGTRFCRQCGEQLIAGSDPMEAGTRNFGRQGPAVAAASSVQLPPSIADAVQGDTARYQQRPMPASPVSYSPPGRFPATQETAGLKKKRRFLKWGAFLLALLISGGIGAGINESANSDRRYVSPEDNVRLDRMRIDDQVRRTVTTSVTEQQERSREEISKRLEAIERAREDAERAAERGDALLSGEKPLDLTPYEYQGASAGQFSRIPGRESLTQRTKDDWDTVVRFYQEKMGAPYIRTTSDRGLKDAVFQSTGTPSVTVRVRETRDRSRQPEIIILRSPFRFPQAQTDVPVVPKVADIAPPPAPPEAPKAKVVR
ncbi:MAG: zinc ribbon domain-containing protein [Acidobacteriota bacterium]